VSVCLVWITSANLDDFASFSDKQMFSKIGNVEELCKLMSGFDNSSECEEMLSGPEDSGNNKTVVSEGSSIALFDPCNPREQTVALPRDPDPRITVWPICTRVKRCGGCCTSDVFTCSPTETKEKFVKVFKTLLPYPGAHTFQFLGVRIVKLEEHTQCDAQCRIKEHECHKYQVYEPRKCQCRCRDERMSLKDSCSKNQIWDDDECNCICPIRNSMSCPPPSVFSETACKCTLKTSVTGEIDLDEIFKKLDEGGFDFLLGGSKKEGAENAIETVLPGKNKEEMDLENLGADGGPDGVGDGDASTTDVTENTTTATISTTTSTTPEPTTTPMPETTPDPCRLKKCFPQWKPKRLDNGRCMCLPPSRG